MAFYETCPDFDLYLLGYLPPEEVGGHIVFDNQSDPAIQQCNNQLYTGPVTRVRVADVIAALGPRVPRAANAQKEYRLATIVVSPDGWLSQEALAFFDFFSKRAAATQELAAHIGFVKTQVKPFALATGGRGSLVVQIGALKPPPLAALAASSYRGEMLASESIAAAFGTNLATSVAAANTIPLPAQLAGTTLKVKDAGGMERAAPLFFVSPQQVNFLVPPGTALGSATLTLTNGSGAVSEGTIRIVRVAPGLFTANADGQGVAAAVALRVKSDGSQSYELVARFDPATNRFVTQPISLGPAGEQVFLILYGSGVRGVSGLGAVSCAIGGQSAQVLFAGASGDFVGLDQINVLLPRSLNGRGEVNLVLTADGQSANIVKSTCNKI